MEPPPPTRVAEARISRKVLASLDAVLDAVRQASGHRALSISAPVMRLRARVLARSGASRAALLAAAAAASSPPLSAPAAPEAAAVAAADGGTGWWEEY